MKKVLALCAFTLLVTFAFGQPVTIPQNYRFRTDEDCREYAPQVKLLADWLIETPLNNNPKHKVDFFSATQFIMSWIEATPDFTFGIPPAFSEVSDKNLEIIGVLMASMASYVIERDYKAERDEVEQFALKNAVDFYDANIAYLKKNKKIANYRTE